MTTNQLVTASPTRNDGALTQGGPTARQECFLRRHHLWSEDLTKKRAYRLIEDFIADKRLKSLLKEKKPDPTTTLTTPGALPDNNAPTEAFSTP